MSKQIIFVNRGELLTQRQELMAEAQRWLEKMVSLNCTYNYYIKKSTDKPELMKLTERLVHLNSNYVNKIYKINKKLRKLEDKIGEGV